MALTIAGLPPHPSRSLVHLVATAAPRRERIASSRSIVHYEKQKCTARQWRDPRSASNNRPNYIRSLVPYLFLALFTPRRMTRNTLPEECNGKTYETERETKDKRESRGKEKKRTSNGRRKKRTRRIRRAREQDRGREDRDEALGGSANSRIECVYDEKKTKTPDDGEATSYESVSLSTREKTRVSGYASDEISSLLVLSLLQAFAVVAAAHRALRIV